MITAIKIPFYKSSVDWGVHKKKCIPIGAIGTQLVFKYTVQFPCDNYLSLPKLKKENIGYLKKVYTDRNLNHKKISRDSALMVYWLAHLHFESATPVRFLDRAFFFFLFFFTENSSYLKRLCFFYCCYSIGK
jgi:hypothetical protein